MDGGAWRAAGHGVAKSQIGLSEIPIDSQKQQQKRMM